MLLFYFTAFLVLDILFRKIRHNRAATGGRISIWISFLLLVAIELFLRYGLHLHDSYQEMNGRIYYSSAYRSIKFEDFINRTSRNGVDLKFMVHRPDNDYTERKTEFEYFHDINQLGIREKEFNREETDTSFVILSLGDSFTEGVGAPGDSTWTRLLENRLRERFGPYVLNINAGCSSSDPFYQYYLLKNQLDSIYHPDLVILNINSTDIFDYMIRGGLSRFDSKNIHYHKAPWWETIYAFSYISRYLIHQFIGTHTYLFTQKRYETLHQEALTEICSLLQHEFAELSASLDFTLLYVFSCIEYELDDESFEWEPCMNSLNESGIRAIELKSAFNAYPGEKSDLFWQLDNHNNSKGYDLWAEALYRFIISDSSLAVQILNFKSDTDSTGGINSL